MSDLSSHSKLVNLAGNADYMDYLKPGHWPKSNAPALKPVSKLNNQTDHIDFMKPGYWPKTSNSHPGFFSNVLDGVSLKLNTPSLDMTQD